jgi:Stage II sporulation protein
MVVAAGLGACHGSSDSEGVAAYEAPQRWAMGAELDEDLSGDLRPEALELIRARGEGEVAGEVTSAAADGPVAQAWTVPATIRVWRRGLDGSTSSCSGRVDVLPLERYVKGVLPHEWIRSWHGESLRAGAIAIRTYAANWIMNGGKYTCADLDDTTASQVYKDETFAVTNTAVDATASTFVMKNAAPVFAEYSAENGHPTAQGISDSVCAGQTRFGHGRGTCQWGSQRWASQGQGHKWILEHYYPGATVTKVGGGGGGGGGEIIVDSANGNNDAAKARVEYTGAWTASSASPGFHGTDYRFIATEESSAPATFYFNLTAAGARTIDAWWVAGTNRSAAASFVAYDADGAEVGRTTANQQAGGGQWNALGTYAFKAGWNRVVLSRWQAPGSVVIADAIRVR